ncbi:MAG: HAMP domain-containing sensor histidine kinase [Woeseiaceae bacterium]
MKFRNSLRFRILFSYLIFGISLGGLMALVHYLSLNELEEMLVYEHVEDEMQYFIALTDNNKNVSHIKTNKFSAFKIHKSNKVKAYPFLDNLNDGMHEKDFNNHSYTISVKERGDKKYYVLYDETAFENRESFLLVTLSLSIILAILFALWFGYWISGKIILPISHLAIQVGQLQAGQLEIKLSDKFADDEVRQLAESFDDFMHKLHLFVERERSFTADASHELRTPLAIIQGAVEVMIAKGNMTEDDIKRVERIERAARDMNQNLTALLVLAREPSTDIIIESETELSKIVEGAIASFQEVSSSKNFLLNVSLNDSAKINAPSNIVSVLISNIIRNAFLYTEKGTVKILLEHNKFVVSDSGVGILDDDLPHIFEQGYRGENALGQGSGLGLSLAKRICDYYKWELSIESIKDKGTTVSWTF